jgi:hypothetical protein
LDAPLSKVRRQRNDLIPKQEVLTMDAVSSRHVGTRPTWALFAAAWRDKALL